MSAPDLPSVGRRPVHGAERCEPLHDDDGQLVAIAHVSPDISDAGRDALREMVTAARRQFEADLAADPTIAERQAASRKGSVTLATSKELPEPVCRYGYPVAGDPAGAVQDRRPAMARAVEYRPPPRLDPGQGVRREAHMAGRQGR